MRDLVPLKASLSALRIEHMYKIVHVKEEKYGMHYVYFQNRVFNHFKIVCEKDTPGTIKQMFTLNTLIENECVEEKVGIKSQVSELIDAQEKLSMEMEELRLELAAKDAEITRLKLRDNSYHDLVLQKN